MGRWGGDCYHMCLWISHSHSYSLDYWLRHLITASIADALCANSTELPVLEVLRAGPITQLCIDFVTLALNSIIWAWNHRRDFRKTVLSAFGSIFPTGPWTQRASQSIKHSTCPVFFPDLSLSSVWPRKTAPTYHSSFSPNSKVSMPIDLCQ